MSLIQNLYNKYHNIIQYFGFSVLSTILDTAAVWVLFHFCSTSLGVSNTIGVILGFILDFFLSAKFVFQTKYGVLSFLVYLVTFLFGLAVANFLIIQSYALAIQWVSEGLAFLFAKGVSIVLPFFVLYFIRKKLYACLNKRYQNHD
ncbi:MAG: GtrA family protein [Eubacteriales bacterium]|nr:GtrA family protein [Eubacteriales bacterium]